MKSWSDTEKEHTSSHANYLVTCWKIPSVRLCICDQNIYSSSRLTFISYSCGLLLMMSYCVCSWTGNFPTGWGVSSLLGLCRCICHLFQLGGHIPMICTHQRGPHMLNCRDARHSACCLVVHPNSHWRENTHRGLSAAISYRVTSSSNKLCSSIQWWLAPLDDTRIDRQLVEWKLRRLRCIGMWCRCWWSETELRMRR